MGIEIKPFCVGPRHRGQKPEPGRRVHDLGHAEVEGFEESEDTASCVDQVPLFDTPQSSQPSPETPLQKRVREHLDSLSEQPLPAPKPYGDALGSLDIADEVFEDETKKK